MAPNQDNAWKRAQESRSLWLAFPLGLLWFPVVMFLGEGVGFAAALGFMLVYYFVCQLLLSGGHERAYVQDMRVMLALNAGVGALAVIVFFAEKRQVFLIQAIPMLLCAGVGTCAGAVIASLLARRRASRQGP